MTPDPKKSVLQNSTMKLVTTSGEFKARGVMPAAALPAGTVNATLAIALTAAGMQHH